MRNMYDYAYEYEYQYHPERAGEMFAVVFASLWETKFLDSMNFKTLEKPRKWAFSRVFCGLRENRKLS